MNIDYFIGMTTSSIFIALGIIMSLSLYDLISWIGMIFILGGEVMLGVDIVRYAYNKSTAPIQISGGIR